MPIPKHVRQWDIYRAHLGGAQDCWLLILSSTETNAIIESMAVACEVVPQSVETLTPSPLCLPVNSSHTGLEWPAALSIATLTSIPKNCLVALEGRLESIAIRTAALKGLGILFGTEAWP